MLTKAAFSQKNRRGGILQKSCQIWHVVLKWNSRLVSQKSCNAMLVSSTIAQTCGHSTEIILVGKNKAKNEEKCFCWILSPDLCSTHGDAPKLKLSFFTRLHTLLACVDSVGKKKGWTLNLVGSLISFYCNLDKTLGLLCLQGGGRGVYWVIWVIFVPLSIHSYVIINVHYPFDCFPAQELPASVRLP